MGSGHDDGAGKVWLAQVICRLVYSVYQDNGNYYNNGSAAATATAAATTAATVTATGTAAALAAATEMVMTTTTNVNKLLVTEARVDQLDCGGTWTLNCRRSGADDGLSCTDELSSNVVVRLYLPAKLSAHFEGQPAVSVGLPDETRDNAVTVIRCDGDGSGGDGNQVTCSARGEMWPPRHKDPAATADVADQHGYNWKYLFVIVFITAGGVGNILVCLAVCLDRQLQNVTNYFLLSLAIADLLVCLFVMPLGAIPGFYGKP